MEWEEKAIKWVSQEDEFSNSHENIDHLITGMLESLFEGLEPISGPSEISDVNFEQMRS